MAPSCVQPLKLKNLLVSNFIDWASVFGVLHVSLHPPW